MVEPLSLGSLLLRFFAQAGQSLGISAHVSDAES